MILALALVPFVLASGPYEAMKSDYRSQGCCDGSNATLRGTDGVRRTCDAARGVALGHCDTIFGYALMSGDPTHDSVVLMALLDPTTSATQISYAVFSDAAAATQVATGVVAVNAEFKNAKVVVGGLAAGTHYWYRFSHGDDASDLARTKTLPQNADEVRVMSMSCSNAYVSLASYCKAAEVVDAEGIDVAFHLGDFVYEYDSALNPNALTYIYDEYFARDPSFQIRNTGPPPALGAEPGTVVTVADRMMRVRTYLQDECSKALFQSVPLIMLAGDHERINDHAAPSVVNPGWIVDGSHNDTVHGSSQTRIEEQNRAFYSYSPTNRGGYLYPTTQQALTLASAVFDTGVARFVTVETRLHRVGGIPDLFFLEKRTADFLALPDVDTKIGAVLTELGTLIATKDMDTTRRIYGDAQTAEILGEIASTPTDSWFTLMTPEPVGLGRDAIVFSALIKMAGEGILDVMTEVIPKFVAFCVQLIGSPHDPSLGNVTYFTNEWSGSGWAPHTDAHEVRTAMNARARSMSIGGDMHEWKVRRASTDNERVDEVVVPSLSMMMDSMKLAPWFPTLSQVVLYVNIELIARGISPILSPNDAPETIFNTLIDLIEGPSQESSNRFDNGFVTSHFTRASVTHTAHLARGIVGTPVYLDPSNPALGYLMEYAVVPAADRQWTTTTATYEA